MIINHFKIPLAGICLLTGLWCMHTGSNFAARGEEGGFLVRGGVANAEIVIAEEPARMTKLAASELQTYVEKITGAKLPVLTAPGEATVRIYVGKSRFTDELGLGTEGLKYGAFRMDSGPDWLALLGPDEDFVPVEPYIRRRSRSEIRRVEQEWDEITGETFSVPHFSLYSHYHKSLNIWEHDDAGTLNAVYEFLRDLGVRWYFPGELGEFVPRQTDIPLPDGDRVVRPDFDLRELGYWQWFEGASEEELLWNLRLGLHRGHDIRGLTQPSHGMKFVHGRDEYAEANPDHFALWDGEPATDHKRYGAPCLSSEELFENHVRYVRAVFDHFDEPMISLDVVDGFSRGVCECEDCKDMATPERGRAGSMSDYVWGYINRVAEEIYSSHPERMVNALSYGAYRLPPENIEEMSPNLTIQECRSRSRFYDPETRQYYRDIREDWLEILPSQQWYVREYYTHSRERGEPVFFPRLIAQDLREMKHIARGERIGVYQHSPSRDYPYHYLAVQHLNLYVTTRLWWDVDQDLDGMLEEYYTLFYGPARDEMRDFIEYSEQNWMDMTQDGDKIDRALELLEAAQDVVAVASDPDYGRRIRLIADYVAPLQDLREQLRREREDVPEYRVLRTGLSGRGRFSEKEFDGRLDEIWPDSPRVGFLADTETGDAPEHATRFQVLREGRLLYFGIRCSDPDMDNLNIATTKDNDKSIFEGDHVSLLIETATHSYYEIVINPAGALLDADHGERERNTAWTSGADVETHIGDDYWSAEIRVPIAGEGARAVDPLVGLDGLRPSNRFPWYFNIGRRRIRNGTVEHTAYSPTGERDFHVRDRFARLWGK